MKTILIIMVMFFSVSAYGNTETNSVADVNNSKVENTLSQEEFVRITKRVEEIQNMDKSKLSAKEKRALRKELRNDRRILEGGGIYIGAGTLLVIIILLLILL